MSGAIEIKKATIHFIYSFMPVTNEMALKQELIKEICSIHDNLPGIMGRIGKPIKRIGISSYMALKLEMGYLNFPTLKGKLDGIDITIEPTIRIFPIGSSCCLSVSADTKEIKNRKINIDLDDVHKILHLVSQKKNQSTRYKITDIASNYYKFEEKKCTIYNIFRFLVDKIIENINLYKKNEEDVKLLCEKFLNEKFEEPQCPWVVSVLEVKGSAYEAFCGSFSKKDFPLISKFDAIRKYNKDIAPILYRSVTGSDFQIEPAYVPTPFAGNQIGLANMNVDARLFVHMSRRSVLCICKNQKKDPPKYFIPVLLDLCEMTHSRWQALIILNRVLDDSLKNFTRKKSTTRVRIRSIISLIDKLTTCLEDPASYVIGGDALKELHEKLIDTYRLKDLVELMLKKLDMLEKLFQHGLELSWTERA